MSKILLIDDDIDFTKMMGYQFENQQIDLQVAHTREVALEAVKDPTIQLILLDVFFPNKDNGLALLHELHTQLPKEIPVVLITGLTNELFLQEPNVDKYLSISKELISKADGANHIVTRVKEILLENK